ncbi:MAG: hypothetical protein CMH83_15880 [Nocardioides sp.]|nr:hypothetical protein [Nocardioides sp.]
MTDPWALGGAPALQTHAPTAASALHALVGQWPEVLDVVELAAIRTAAAEALGLPPLVRPPTGPRRLSEQPPLPVLAFAEQYAVDVTVLDVRMRDGWLSAFGRRVEQATEALHVADVVPRARVVLDTLFGDDEWFDPELRRSGHSPLLLAELEREVRLLDGLDEVTSELVRLRVARAVGARDELALRYLPAVEAGADAATFQAADHYRGAGLTPTQQAALALADGAVFMPADLRTADVRAVHEHLTPAQAVEVVLDVVVHSRAKGRVALGRDLPGHDGVRLFSIDDEGQRHLV